MVIVMDIKTKDEQVQQVTNKLKELGYGVHVIRGVEKIVIGAIGSGRQQPLVGLETMPGVENVVPITQPFKLVSREFKREDSTIKIGDIEFGSADIPVIAGPCAVESKQQLLDTALAVKQAGASILRGGAFKPRTSPYSFQGLEQKGLEYLAEAREETGLPVVTEVTDPSLVPVVAEYADVLQIGARNMQNFHLLTRAGESGKPIILKRGLAATITEWLMAAEYIASTGNYNIILCERGIRTYENMTRNTLDLSAIPVVKELSHLPVIVDPSHATGKRRWVPAMAKAAVAGGADGIMVEVHCDPNSAMSDGPQSLSPSEFAQLMPELSKIAWATGRTISKNVVFNRNRSVV